MKHRTALVFVTIFTPLTCSRSFTPFKFFSCSVGTRDTSTIETNNPHIKFRVFFPLYSRRLKQFTLRGGEKDMEREIPSQDTESDSRPRKKSKLDDHSSSIRPPFSDTNAISGQSEHDSSSAECLNCRRLIKHAHSNISVKETTDEPSISMNGHKLESFALEFFSSLDELPVTVDAYNVLLDHCLDSQHLTTALALYEKMKNESIAPTYETCDLLMSICESSKQWTLAVQVAEDMLAAGLCADERTYEWMMKICVKLKEWDIVLDLYDELIQSKLEPTANIRTFAIQACHGQRLWRRAIDELNQFRKYSPAASLPFSYVIETCLDAGQRAEAQKLIDEHQNLQAKELQNQGITDVAVKQEQAETMHLADSEEPGPDQESASDKDDSASTSIGNNREAE